MSDARKGNGADETDAKHGFQFPGEFEITAVGEASGDLRTRVPALLEKAGLEVLHETVRHRHSREGNFISVSIRFQCPSREQYEAAHAALRAEPSIKYTL